MTQQDNRPLSLRRTLSTGQAVTVGQITWDGWRKIKGRMLESLSASEVSRALSSFLALWKKKDDAADSESPEDPEDPKAGGEILSSLANSDLAEHAPAAIQILNAALDDMTCDLFESCIEDEQPPRLAAADAMLLRDAIFAVNDFAGLLAAEKNSFAALLSGFQSKTTKT